MAGEKYIIATVGNAMQIAIRNILNPAGYIFLGKCSDAAALLRSIRSLQPEFIVVDLNSPIKELGRVIYTVDEEMLSACIILGEPRDYGSESLIQNSNVLTFCDKSLNKEILIQTVSMALINFKRVTELNRKLNEMTENYETRKLIERAKGILMDREGISENIAYDKMRKKSMNNRLSMKSIAMTIIKAYGDKK
jgi:response regulator NasT